MISLLLMHCNYQMHCHCQKHCNYQHFFEDAFLVYHMCCFPPIVTYEARHFKYMLSSYSQKDKYICVKKCFKVFHFMVYFVNIYGSVLNEKPPPITSC